MNSWWFARVLLWIHLKSEGRGIWDDIVCLVVGGIGQVLSQREFLSVEWKTL
jgi:hypothetical protein